MRLPKEGDIWLVRYPYITPGNMNKIRPAIIKEIKDENKIIIQKLTTKKHTGFVLFKHPKLKKQTFLSNEKITINDYRLIRYLGNLKQIKN